MELLVVITIIALLIAISVSAFTRSRQAARSVVCLSNLRQVGLLLNGYLSTANGILPDLHNRRTIDEPLPAIDTELADSDINARIFACPSDDRGLFETTGTSYYWNITINGQPIANLFSIVGGDDPRHVPVLADKEGFHPNLRDRVNVLYADNRVDTQLSFVDQIDPADRPDPPEALPRD